MACLFDEVGELTLDDRNDIEQIMRLADDEEWSAIDSLFNGGENELADAAFLLHFGTGIYELDQLADEFGYARVGE